MALQRQYIIGYNQWLQRSERVENGNSRRNEPLFLVSVDKLPTCSKYLDAGQEAGH
jgi:hypothetical protein